MFSDELVGLDIAHRRELKHMASGAQRVIDEQSADVAALRRALRETSDTLTRTRMALTLEEGKRMALQIEVDRLNRLLDTPIG